MNIENTVNGLRATKMVEFEEEATRLCNSENVDALFAVYLPVIKVLDLIIGEVQFYGWDIDLESGRIFITKSRDPVVPIRKLFGKVK